jgi:hypothetical protein
LHRYAPLLPSCLAGFLFSNSVQAQTSPFVDAGSGQNLFAPTGTFPNVQAFGGIDVLFAHNGGTITGTGNLELDVTGNEEFHVVHADGTGSPPGSTAITMTTGQTVINMTQLGPANANARGVHADFGAKVTINDFIITELPSLVFPKGITRGVEAGDFVVESNGQAVGSILDATDTHINMGPRAVGAFAWNSANLSLTNCVITITDPSALGWGISSQNATLIPT